jgi:glutamate carboxypeptidase
MMDQITNYLQEQFSAMIELTEKIINVDSPSNDIAGIQKVADILSTKMREIGMQTRQRDSGKQGMVLIGELPGEKELQPVILLGHMDTVFPKGTVKQRPFKIEGDQMTGPGIFDMKPGLVIGLFAIQALVKLKLNRRPIKMIIVSDEEKLHLDSNTYDIITDECRGGVYGFNLEGTKSDPSHVGTHNRGGMIVDVIVHGRAAHSGAEPEKGRSAIIELAHQIIKLSALSDLQAGIHVNCGMIKGGTSENIIPDRATTSLGVRFRTNQQRDRLLERIKLIVATPTIPDTTTTVKVRTKIDSMEETPAVNELFAELNQVAQQVGYGKLQAVGGGGASDAGIMAARDVPTIDALGVVGDGAHSKEERASAKSLLKRSSLIANFIAQRG